MDGGIQLPAVLPVEKAWYHHKHGIDFPFPKGEELRQMKLEVELHGPETVHYGRVSTMWLVKVHQFLAAMVTRFQSNDGRVTGNWAKAAEEWDLRFAYLDIKERKELGEIIRQGGKLPFDTIPPLPLRRFRNNPRLRDKPVEVWSTLGEQLDEGAIVPFDLEGACLGRNNLQVGGKLPWCVFTTNWVVKTGSQRVRVTCDGGPLKPFFSPEAVGCTLDTNDSMRFQWRERDFFVSFDQHSSFFHYALWPRHRKYMGISIHCGELPVGVGIRLAAKYPQAVLPVLGQSYSSSGNQERERAVARALQDGEFRLVFVYAALMMGASPSVAMLTRVMSALLGAWKLCPVGFGLARETFRAGNYVDDSIFATSGAHFANACELSLRIAVEYIILGFVLNLDVGKSSLLPLRHQVFCGMQLDVRRGCWYSLPEKRVLKVFMALRLLRSVAVVGCTVSVLLVARVVGTIWAVHLVAHRAVSIMCRAMIHVLALHLGQPQLRSERDMHKLKRLLKVAWKGEAIWTVGANAELEFWLATKFRKLRSRMRFDAVRGDLAAWVVRPNGDVLHDIRLFAADTSETGTGGGEFVRHGSIWKMLPGSKTYVRLALSDIGTSSCLRECRGVRRMDVALIPDNVVRAVVVCDAQASVAVLERGSGIPELQAEAAAVFRRQLVAGRILFYQWARRNTDIIEACDDASRLVDAHAFQTAPALFEHAEAEALDLFGVTFHLDAMADLHNVQPGTSLCKLPFFSRWWGPHSSGLDAFAQDWTGLLSWVNPPFALVGRVIALLRDQSAVAAVVLPLMTKSHWNSTARMGAVGVRRVFEFDPNDARFAVLGRAEGTTYSGRFAVVFFDFRTGAQVERAGWRDVPTSQQYRLMGHRRQLNFDASGLQPTNAYSSV